jgi:hypothetical protein
MLHKADATRWAQVGWWKKANGTREVFVQYTNNSGGWPTSTYPARPVGTSTTYIVTRRFEDGFWRFRFYENNTQLTSISTLTWTPTQYAVRGETHLPNNQMPGGYASPLDFWTTYYYVGDSLFGVATATDVYNPSWHGAYRFSGGVHYQVWDRACAS